MTTMAKSRKKSNNSEDCDTSVVDQLLREHEWEQFECKEASAKPKELLKTVVAMANTSGGTLVLGLADAKKATGKKRLLGIEAHRDTVSAFLHEVTKIRPFMIINTEEISIVNVNGYEDVLMVVTIEKSKYTHSTDKNNTYVRRGSSSRKIGAEAVSHLQQERGVVKFEKRVSDVSSLDGLDHTLLERFKRGVKSDTDDNWQFLSKNGLAERKGGNLFLTEAGVLLFGENPAVMLKKKCEIRVVHHHGTEVVRSGETDASQDPFTIRGSLYNQIHKSVEHFKSMVEKSPTVLKGATFQHSLSVPEWVFQEAVTNAVVHRNYFDEDDIKIWFFSNRVEVESPGTYPGDITPDNILEHRFSRNPLIQKTLSRFEKHPNRDIGEGVGRMFKVMKDNNLYDPLYVPVSVCPHTVKVVLYTEERDERWDFVRDHLDSCYTITNVEAREITGEKKML